MSQQLAILIMIDTAAAIKAGNLADHIYLIDNAKWVGSTGEATANLVTAVDGTRVRSQMDAQVLNWLPYGIGDLPHSLPQSFFLSPAAKKTINATLVHPASDPQAPAGSAAADEAATATASVATARVAADEPSPHARGAQHIPRLEAKRMDITGALLGKSKAKGNTALYTYPMPLVTNITGEAVDKYVIFPAQYGSPDLFSKGLYWSATVDTNKVGTYAYTLHITLFNPYEKDGEVAWEPVALTFDSYINVTNEATRNGFLKVPQMLPA
ncbi:hypothetical protein IGB42_01189 [Andreprevotia sp. IGB-42]|uniref:hypothetical protein n=1 Tax=Andreprevotia sp. IGB-42 TaxID=2497473 RepID=UPI001358A391|nr:hypothetical protein [Andreprevotia sp. IGB-42]KAF0814288.1 hypothetical protein IGB42_01189 [Andreprevotia sp. IGB-42]